MRMCKDRDSFQCTGIDMEKYMDKGLNKDKGRAMGMCMGSNSLSMSNKDNCK